MAPATTELMRRLVELQRAELTYQRAKKEWEAKMREWKAKVEAGTLPVTADRPEPPPPLPTAASIRRDRENERRTTLRTILGLIFWLSLFFGVGALTSGVPEACPRSDTWCDSPSDSR